MILTPIPRHQLAHALDRFMTGLGEPFHRAVFWLIRTTSPDRAAGAEAQRHRLAALSLAGGFGMAIRPEGTRCPFNWDGKALNGATEAYVILHEVAHFVLAPPERRWLVDFGLGPGPDTIERDAAERIAILSPLARAEDEAAASLLGIVWEAQLGQPALASFLDQNWMEGLDRSAACHFAAVLDVLRSRRLLNPLPGGSDRAQADPGRRAGRAKIAASDYWPRPAAKRAKERARPASPHRDAKPASIQHRTAPGDSPSLSSNSPDLPFVSPR
jgi:hypothetical protein